MKKHEEVVLLPASKLNKLVENKASRINDVNSPKIKKLRKAFVKEGFISRFPIIINSNFIVQDGHNRLIAAKLELCDVYYKVDNSFDLLEDNRRMNIGTKWNSMDYITSYSNAGQKDYITIKEIHDLYGEQIGFKAILASASNVFNEVCGKIFESVQAGTFVLAKDVTLDTMIGDMKELLLLNDLMNTDYKKPRVHMQMSLAYFWLRKQPNFDKKNFFKKLRSNREKVVPQAGGQKTNRKYLMDLFNLRLRKNKIVMPPTA